MQMHKVRNIKVQKFLASLNSRISSSVPIGFAKTKMNSERTNPNRGKFKEAITLAQKPATAYQKGL